MKTLATLALTAFISLCGLAQTVTNLNNAGAGSLRNVVLNSQPGDVIDFSPSLFSNGNATLNLDYPIPIVHSLTINGHLSNGDTLIINGQDTSQAFFVDGNASSNAIELTINNMVIEDCKKYSANYANYNTNGGAIMALNIARLELDDVHLRNNWAAGDARAGALYCREVDSIFLRSCSLVKNRTDTLTPSQGGGWGGAIRSAMSTLIIDDTEFRNNRCADRGGAIIVWSANTVEIRNSIFKGNQSGLDSAAFRQMSGGAIFLTNTRDYLIENTEFEDNSAMWYGGALHVEGSNLTTEDSLKLINCTFTSNWAGRRGGAVYLASHLMFSSNCTYANNEAVDYGGAVNISSSEGYFAGSTLVNNKATNGGTFDVGLSFVLFKNSTLVSGSVNAEAIYRSNIGTDSIVFSSSIVDGSNASSLFNRLNYLGSRGYNAFSSPLSFAKSSDLQNATASTLGLGPLQINRGSTPTRLPGPASLAINGGNPTDFSPAQNGPIFGRRDIGAAERGVISYDTTLVCGNISWWGNNYNMPGIYSDTAYNANSVDSIGVLVLYSQDTSIENRNGTLVALEQSQGTSYQWVDCGNGFAPVTGATDSTFLPTANGSYAVVLTNGACSDTSDCISYNEVGIEEQSTKQLLTFYPNPTSGSLTLISSENLPQQLEVLDLSGRTISTLKVSSNEIQLPTLSKGIYLLKWEFEGGVIQVDRVVVE